MNAPTSFKLTPKMIRNCRKRILLRENLPGKIMHITRKITVFFLLVIVLRQTVILAGNGNPVVMVRLEGEIVFDGMPDEAAWQRCDPFPMLTQTPVFGKEPTERTDIRILYDDDFIYVGAAMFAKDASRIQANSKKRDEMKPDCDWLGIIFDSYNDNENGLSFWTTPTGLRTDMTVFNDAKEDVDVIPVNSSWNTHWEVKSVVNEKGWFCEVLIPVSSLRFEEKAGQVVMGLILIRWVPYLNEICTYPPIPNEYGAYSPWKVSLAQDVVFPGLKSRRPLYITPYATAGINQKNELNEDETRYLYSSDRKLNAGLDLKYGLTSNLTLDVTVNTDFAQVEADDEQVNLTRFDLYFEEKRQFFLERASIFDFSTGGQSTMFYSRRIGLDEEGNIVPIIGGVRLIGRKKGLDVGFLNMQTMRSDSLPSENYGALRFKKRVLNEYSYVGGIYTSRLGLDGSFNQAYGIDANLRVTGDEYLNVVWGQTFQNGLTNDPFSLTSARYRLGWERRRNVGLHYEVLISGAGNEYNPGMGFQSREDYHIYGGYLNYLWLMPESSPLYRHGPRTLVKDFFSMTRGVRESGLYQADYLVEFKSFWQVSLGGAFMIENVFEDFTLSDDAEVPAGYYTFTQMKGTLSTPMTNPASLLFEGYGGGYYDGHVLNLQFTPNWSISSSVMLGGDYIYSRVDLPSRDQKFISHIGRLKSLIMFSTRLSLSAFVQYNSNTRTIASNIRFRYNPREGNDLWLVYNEGTHTDLRREIPEKPVLANRTIMLKYTYTFRL